MCAGTSPQRCGRCYKKEGGGGGRASKGHQARCWSCLAPPLPAKWAASLSSSSSRVVKSPCPVNSSKDWHRHQPPPSPRRGHPGLLSGLGHSRFSPPPPQPHPSPICQSAPLPTKRGQRRLTKTCRRCLPSALPANVSFPQTITKGLIF